MIEELKKDSVQKEYLKEVKNAFSKVIGPISVQTAVSQYNEGLKFITGYNIHFVSVKID